MYRRKKRATQGRNVLLEVKKGDRKEIIRVVYVVPSWPKSRRRRRKRNGAAVVGARTPCVDYNTL